MDVKYLPAHSLDQLSSQKLYNPNAHVSILSSQWTNRSLGRAHPLFLSPRDLFFSLMSNWWVSPIIRSFADESGFTCVVNWSECHSHSTPSSSSERSPLSDNDEEKHEVNAMNASLSSPHHRWIYFRRTDGQLQSQLLADDENPHEARTNPR